LGWGGELGTLGNAVRGKRYIHVRLILGKFRRGGEKRGLP